VDRTAVITILRAHENEFRAAGKGFSRGGLDYFGRLDDLEHRLEELLGSEVDVVEEPVRRERFQNEIDKDRVIAF